MKTEMVMYTIGKEKDTIILLKIGYTNLRIRMNKQYCKNFIIDFLKCHKNNTKVLLMEDWYFKHHITNKKIYVIM